MNKNQIIRETEKAVEEIIKNSENDYELVEVKWEKEAGQNFLRVYVDKEDGISLENCAEISRKLNKIIDSKDIYDEKFFLEVSSPGIFRVFTRDKDYIKNIGNQVEIKTYKKINGSKLFVGELKDFDNETVCIEKDDSEMLEIRRENIAKICRHIIF